MIRLNVATTDLLACTPSSTNAVKTMVSYTDVTATTWTGNSEPHSLAAASKATICGTPAASTVREIDHVTVKATGGANTVIILQTISATDYEIVQAVLATNETLEYTHAAGWKVLDANGQTKQVMSGYLPLAGGTMLGDLLFTDATYDIGKTGATRPRDLFLSRNAVIGGTLTAAGDAALNGANLTTTATTVTAFAGATTLLTLGGTGATSVVAIPGTLAATGTTGALTIGGGFYAAKASIVGGTLNTLDSITATKAANISYVATYTGGAQTYMQSQASAGYMGTGTSHALVLLANAATVATFAVGGACTLPSTLGVTGGAWFGSAALATNATTGHQYIITSAGAPTGVPASKTGQVAIQYDTTNNYLYVYNGAWKKSTAYA